MLKELNSVRQVSGEPRRRWFSSDTMDLIVWYDAADAPLGFQFCYDKGDAEKALTWRRESGFSHTGVDDGEGNSRLNYKATPILVANGRFDGQHVLQLLQTQGAGVPPELQQFIAATIAQAVSPDSPL